MDKSKAIFLDKDGTLVRDVPYNVDPDKLVFYPDVPDALHQLMQAGYKLIIITNQPGVALGYFPEEKLTILEKEISLRLLRHQVVIDGFYYCPHHESGIIESYTLCCTCRKPRPGLILKAAEDMNIDLSSSWMVGDILNDVEAGNRSGCRTVLIDNGNETEWLHGIYREPDLVVKTLKEAADLICMEGVDSNKGLLRRFEHEGNNE